MAAKSDPVAAALAEVDRLFRLEQDWSDKRATAGRQLEAIEATVGADVLDGADLDGLVRRMGDLRGTIAVADAAITEARNRREAARRAVWEAERDVLLEQARAKRKEADEREPKTAKLLAELLAWEGCDYAPAQSERPPLQVGRQLGGAPMVVVVTVTRTMLLRQEAEGLEAQAAARVAQKVGKAGQITAGSAEDLRRQFADLSPLAIGPTAHSVEAWLAEGLAKYGSWRAKLGVDHVGHRAPLEVVLVWSDGAIVPGQSYFGPRRGWDHVSEQIAREAEERAPAVLAAG